LLHFKIYPKLNVFLIGICSTCLSTTFTTRVYDINYTLGHLRRPGHRFVWHLYTCLSM